MQRPAWWRERERAGFREIGRLWVGLSLSALLAALPQPFIVVKSGGAESGWEPGPQGVASSFVSEEKWKIESAE